MTELLAGHLEQRKEALPQLIIPVPLGKSRLAERGFNQAVEIAKPISRRLKIPLTLSTVSRHRDTSPQSNLHKKERYKNIQGAFSINKLLSATHVAIVDDVMTTGVTAGEIARILRKAGVEKVEVWVVARTP